jgi:hypothetical protein
VGSALPLGLNPVTHQHQSRCCPYFRYSGFRIPFSRLSASTYLFVFITSRYSGEVGFKSVLCSLYIQPRVSTFVCAFLYLRVFIERPAWVLLPKVCLLFLQIWWIILLLYFSVGFSSVLCPLYIQRAFSSFETACVVVRCVIACLHFQQNNNWCRKSFLL